MEKNKKNITKLVFSYIAAILLVATVIMPTTIAGTNSVDIFLGVNPSVTYHDSIVYYTIYVINYILPGATNANFNIIFAPPKSDGTPDTDNLIVIDTDQFIAVGEIIVYDSTNYSDLAVTLNLDPGVEVAYGQAFYHVDYIAVPPYTADGSKDIPVEIIYPELCIEKTVDFDADGTYTDAERDRGNRRASLRSSRSVRHHPRAVHREDR